MARIALIARLAVLVPRALVADRYRRSGTVQVALVKVGALGDVLRTTALLPALKRLHPDAEVTWITSRAAFPLLRFNSLVSQLRDHLALQGDWLCTDYDWVISLDDEAETCRLATRLSHRRLSGAYEDSSGNLRYTPDVEAWFGIGRLRPPDLGGLARANQLKRANLRSYDEILYQALRLPLPVERPALTVPVQDQTWALEWLGTHDLLKRRIVGLNTAAGGRWRFKSWGIEDTARLARDIATRLDASVLVLGGIAQQERNAEIVARANSRGVAAAPCDLGLLSFAALIGQTNVLVSSDSLAMHIGIALQRPVIAFFGPTSDAEINLFGLGEKIATALECRCCYLSDCEVRPHCMQSIHVDVMFRAVSRWLLHAPAVGNPAN